MISKKLLIILLIILVLIGAIIIASAALISSKKIEKQSQKVGLKVPSLDLTKEELLNLLEEKEAKEAREKPLELKDFSIFFLTYPKQIKTGLNASFSWKIEAPKGKENSLVKETYLCLVKNLPKKPESKEDCRFLSKSFSGKVFIIMRLMECMRIGGSESEPKKINKDSEIILVKKIVKFFWKHKTLSLCLMMAIFLSYRFLFPNSIFLDRKDTLAQAILFWFFVAFFYIEAKKEEIKPRLSKLKLREYVIFLIPLSSSLLLFFFGVKYFDYETSLSFIITFAIAILIVFAFCALIGIVIFFYVSYPRVIYLFSKFFIFLFRHRIYKKN